MIDERLAREVEEGYAIVVVWLVEDVQEVRPDLDEEQCVAVLAMCDRRYDAAVGITWETIEWYADSLFPAPEPDADQKEGAR